MTKNNKGFTIIELILAMTGISVLLIIVATTTIQLMNIYQKGVNIKMINSAGREIGDTLRRDGMSAIGSDIKIVPPDNPRAGRLGRICFGSYSYVWNTPDSLRSSSTSEGVSYEGTDTKIVLARVQDIGGVLCQDDGASILPKTIKTGAPDFAREMLGEKSTGVAIHDVSLSNVFTDEQGRSGYIVSYKVGTYEQDTIDTSDSSCKTEGESGSNYNYCAINIFSELIITERPA